MLAPLIQAARLRQTTAMLSTASDRP